MSTTALLSPHSPADCHDVRRVELSPRPFSDKSISPDTTPDWESPPSLKSSPSSSSSSRTESSSLRTPRPIEEKSFSRNSRVSDTLVKDLSRLGLVLSFVGYRLQASH